MRHAVPVRDAVLLRRPEPPRGTATRAQSARRTRVRRQAALAFVLVSFLTTALAQLPPHLPDLPEHHLESRLLTLTNEARTAAGVEPLSQSAVLTQAARHHAEEMVRLGYFSHVSPTPGREAPEQRVRLVGGTHALLGENLAEVSARDLEIAERIVGGWMESPGHRTNVLQAAWTHVGFGLAEDANGRAYVAQVFAADPNPIRSLEATRSGERTLALRFEVTVATTGLVAMATNDAGVTPLPAVAGSTLAIVVDGLSSDVPTHVRLGWAPAETSALIGQQSGWFDPASGRWTEDWSNPERHAEVLDYAATEPVQGVTLRLTFEREPRGLVLLVDGTQPAISANGTTIEAHLTGRDGVREVIVGLAEPDGRVRVLHAFEVHVDAERVHLR